MLNTYEAGRVLGVTPLTVRRYIHQGLIPAKMAPGGKFRIFKADLADYLRSLPDVSAGKRKRKKRSK